MQSSGMNTMDPVVLKPAVLCVSEEPCVCVCVCVCGAVAKRCRLMVFFSHRNGATYEAEC